MTAIQPSWYPSSDPTDPASEQNRLIAANEADFGPEPSRGLLATIQAL